MNQLEVGLRDILTNFVIQISRLPSVARYDSKRWQESRALDMTVIDGRQMIQADDSGR